MRPARGAALALLLFAAVGTGCNDSGANGSAGDGGLGGGLAPAPTCAWNTQPPQLQLPASEVRGVLRGMSRNASTTCTRQRGTGGPEAIYLLQVTERSLVELEVKSTIDTVIAVRRVCDDPLSELACNDGPAAADPGVPIPPSPVSPPFFPPAGAPPPLPPTLSPPVMRDAGVLPDMAPVDASEGAPGGGAALAQIVFPGGTRDAHLRVVLDPGNYFVIVDEAEPFGVGGEYLLKASSSPPLAQSSCAGALTIKDGTSLPAEELDLGTQLASSCTGAEKRPALYYSANVPSGQRLTARAQVRQGGDRPWTPVLQLLSACREGLCLATDRPGPNGQPLLRYVNNGPIDQQVILAVGSSAAVSGALFRLDVSIGEPLQNGTCASARPLKDGQVLRNQDLSEGQMSATGMCRAPGGGPSLFYSATLLEGQDLHLTIDQSAAMTRTPVFMTLKDGCNDVECRGSVNERLDYTNPGPGIRTVVIEVSGFLGAPVTLFDLMVSIPLLPAGITVDAGRGLKTSEAGGAVTFEVVLDSPPLHPVVIPLVSSDPAEGTVSPASVQFDPAGWQQPQTVTVTGVDDSRKDGPRPYTIQVGPASSQDERYTRLPATMVALVNRDDEAGFAVEANIPLFTSESGAKATFTVQLNRAPTATVRLPLSSSNPGEGVVSPGALVFEPQSWNQTQTVTVTGVDDPDQDGAQSYRIVTGVVTSGDPEYAGIDPDDLEARNGDNEFERVDDRLVSGDLSCLSGAGGGHRIAVERGGTLFVVMECRRPAGSSGSGGSGGSSGTGGSGGGGGSPNRPRPFDVPTAASAFVATSFDGGRTWGAPVDTRVSTFEAHVAALEAGVAVVVGHGPFGLSVARSEDAGESWQAPTTLFSSSVGNVQLAAAGNRVVLTGQTATGPMLWFSEDAGRTWKQSEVFGQRTIYAVGIDAGTGVVGMVSYNDVAYVWRQSRDGGATFDMGLTLGGDDVVRDVFAISPATVYAVGNESLLAVPRDGSARREIDGRSTASNNWVLVADELDNVTLIESQQGPEFQMLEARHLPAGAASFLSPKPLSNSHQVPSAVALSENAVAIRVQRDSQIFVSVETWP